METVLNRLDPRRPELASVQNEMAAGNVAGAAEALLRYFRTRQTPSWYTESPPAPAIDDEARDPAAESILRREYTFVGKTATLTPDLDWNADPLNDREWTIELNRHYTWVRLVDAYNRTGNPAYAHDFLAQLRDWYTDNPRPDSPRDSRNTWRTLECGIRLSGSWPRCFVGILNSPLFTPDALCLMLDAIWQQADYLTHVHGGGNWLVTETAGLMTAAVFLPEFADAPRWREIAFARLEQEIDRQVLPDGAQVELTPHYHSVTMGAFMNASRIAEFNRIAVPPAVTAGIANMARYLLNISKPDLRIPMFNDSDHLDLERRLRPFATDAHPDIQYVLARGGRGIAPAYTSVSLPYAGQYIMRSGWDEQALYLAMDAGPYGYGHQHEDKLQIEVHAFGRSHILDPGRFTYAGGPWRRYFLSTQSHSTMLVNDQGQNRRATPRRRWIGRDPQDNLWVSTETFDFAVGAYDEGYGNAPHDVVHIRKIFFRRAEYWIVHDLLVGPDDATESYASSVQYQFGTPGVAVSADGRVIASRNEDANLAIFPVSDRPFDIQFYEGEVSPPRGWIGWSLHRAHKTPATLAAIRQERVLPISMDTVLYPYRGTAIPGIAVRRLTADSPSRSVLEISGPEWRDVYRCSHVPREPSAPMVEWKRYDLEGNPLEDTAYIPGGGDPEAGPNGPRHQRDPLQVEPALRSLTVTVPTAGRLVCDYGFAYGGGYLFQQEQEAEPGETLLRLPSMRAGQAYVYAVRLLGTDGSRLHGSGRVTPDPRRVHTFETDDLADWSKGTIMREEGNAFLRAAANPETKPVYVSVTHPLPRIRGDNLSVTLRYRMPFSPGGDWCYGKVSLTDTAGRRWSAYVTSRPHGPWRTLSLQREDFRRDDRGQGGRAAMSPDAVLSTLAVTVRKGSTEQPVAAVLDIDDVSWRTD